MNMLFAFCTTRQFQIAAAGRASTNKHRVIALVQDALQAVDIGLEVCSDAHVEDIVDLFIEDRGWQSEGGDLAAHKAATGRLVIVEIQLVAQWREISRYGE